MLIDIGAIQPHIASRRERSERREQGHEAESSHDVSLSGSGLVLSILVYQGIRMKNRK